MARQPGDSDFSNVNVSGVIKVNGTDCLSGQGTAPAFVNADLANMAVRMNALIVALQGIDILS